MTAKIATVQKQIICFASACPESFLLNVNFFLTMVYYCFLQHPPSIQNSNEILTRHHFNRHSRTHIGNDQCQYKVAEKCS